MLLLIFQLDYLCLDGEVCCEKYLNGINNNEVWYYEVVGGGHDWPGASGNMDINASEEVWNFVKAFDLNGKIE